MSEWVTSRHVTSRSAAVRCVAGAVALLELLDVSDVEEATAAQRQVRQSRAPARLHALPPARS